MTFRKILVAVDFSSATAEAVRLGTELCAPETELVIVHVWEPVPYPGDTSVITEAASRFEAEEAEIEVDLESAKRQAESSGVRYVSTLLRTGAPWREIVRIIHDDRAFDLAVVATHGRSGLAHALLGSVTEKVIRHVRCPVLVVRVPGSDTGA